MKPEMVVRQLVHKMGFRYRLHQKDLPGKPDLVFPSRRKAIFVHGCFWHQHKKEECSDGRIPKSNTSYWTPKLKRNVERDKAATKELKRLGWEVLVIWECEIKNTNLEDRLGRFLNQR
jgi:DNA mismatch endonuclease (patch repair protein)